MIVIYANLFDTSRKILTIMKQVQNQLNSERCQNISNVIYFRTLVRELSIDAKGPI